MTMPSTSSSHREPLLRIGVGLCVCAAAGLLIYLLVFPNHKATCEAHLRQIALALQNYSDEHGSFPPAYTLGPDNKPWHSWRVLILPQLGEEELYKEYRFDEPWDSEHNRKLAARMPAALGCPANDNEPRTTSYVAFVGERTVWPGPNGARVIAGQANMLQLMEIGDSRIVWTEPRDLSPEEALAEFAKPSVHGEGHHASTCDGKVRFIIVAMRRETLDHAINCCKPRSLDLVAPRPMLAGTKKASELKSTEIVASAHLPLDANKTQIWCGTFQMAWDELRAKCGGSRVDLRPTSVLSDALNQHPFSRKALSPESMLIHADSTGPRNDKALRAEFAKRFPNADVQIHDTPDNPARLRVLAFLEKQLPFQDPFERLRQPLQFGIEERVAVQSFGMIGSNSDEDPEAIFKDQMFICDYVSDEDFIIELATKSQRKDRIVLANVTPEGSLAETWSSVAARIKSPDSHHKRRHLESNETFQAPVLALNLQREYSELYQAIIQPCKMFPQGAAIQSARQEIRFQLDENGAALISIAKIEILTLNGGPVDKPRRLIFDGPFLLALREGENEPYFLAWIATAEVMEKK
jgi:hypothetical protein